MTLATKNGAIIVKDGVLAESCGCCGGWYCCASPQCLATPSSVSVTIVSDDYYAQYSMKDNIPTFGTPFESSAAFFGSAINGTHQMTKVGETPGGTSTLWTATFASVPSGCSPLEMKVSLSFGSTSAFSFSAELETLRIYAYSPSSITPISGLNCSLPRGTTSTGAYSVRSKLIWSAGSSCVDGAYVLSKTFPVEGFSVTSDDRVFVDGLMAQFGGAANSWGMLAANRNNTETYGAMTTSANTRTGSNLFTVTVTVSP